jgi:hypothetical protein
MHYHGSHHSWNQRSGGRRAAATRTLASRRPATAASRIHSSGICAVSPSAPPSCSPPAPSAFTWAGRHGRRDGLAADADHAAAACRRTARSAWPAPPLDAAALAEDAGVRHVRREGAVCMHVARRRPTHDTDITGGMSGPPKTRL